MLKLEYLVYCIYVMVFLKILILLISYFLLLLINLFTIIVLNDLVIKLVYLYMFYVKFSILNILPIVQQLIYLQQHNLLSQYFSKIPWNISW